MRTLLCVIAVLALAACESGDDFAFERINPETLNHHPAYSQVTTVNTGGAKFVYVAGQVDRPIDYTPGSNRCRSDDLPTPVIRNL